MNFPFQCSDGIQTSVFISESEVGLSSAATRQNAGSRLNDACCAGANEGSVKAPASTASARVIVAAGRASVERPSQVAAKVGNDNSRLANDAEQFMSACREVIDARAHDAIGQR